MAARSLSLDAPVFAPAEPDVLTSEEPDLSDTLHGPLDAEPAPTAEMQAEPGPPEGIEAIEEIEPVAATGEFEAPAGLTAPAAGSAETPTEEPMEFDPEATEIESELAPMPAPVAAAAAPVVEEFSQEHEFDPSELDPPVARTAEVIPTPPPAPEPMAAAEELPSPEPEAILMPAPAPQAAIALPAPAPTPSEAPGAFDSLVGAATVPAAATAPAGSAEVAVPVDMVQQIAQRVISQVSERVIREIAWDVIPGLAEKLIRAEIERIKARAESERD